MIITLEVLRKEAAHVLLPTLRPFIWTPQGLVDLSEPHDLREIKPCLLGTWAPSRSEEAPLREKEHRPSRFLEKDLGGGDVDQRNFVVTDSSHRLGPMLG